MGFRVRGGPPAFRRKKADPEGTPMGHPAKLVEDARYFEALEIRWERPVCPQVSAKTRPFVFNTLTPQQPKVTPAGTANRQFPP